MIRGATCAAVVVVIAIGVGGASVTSAGDVNIGIRIGTPPPPPPRVVVVTPPPPVVIEPGVPVYYHRGWYYLYSSGAWFMADRHEGPWVYVVSEHVPARVVALPRAYERLPVGHVRRVGPHPWAHDEGRHGHRGHDRD